jgi:hypothetical protein
MVRKQADPTGVCVVETPKYRVLRRMDGVELRQYPELILATTKMKAGDASNEAFGIIAGYIFGENKANKHIAMTAPVISSSESGIFSMSFVMPSSFGMKTLPKPVSRMISIERKRASKFAVIRFSGFASKGKVKGYEARLRQVLKEENIRPRGKAILMRYNPPWTLPFMRRNEVALEIVWK